MLRLCNVPQACSSWLCFVVAGRQEQETKHKAQIWPLHSLYCDGQHWGVRTVRYPLKLDDGSGYQSCQTGRHLWEKSLLAALRSNRIIFLVEIPISDTLSLVTQEASAGRWKETRLWTSLTM